MAILGNIAVEIYGTTVVLANKYMRLSNCKTSNEWRLTDVPQPDGADGNKNPDKMVLLKFTDVSGTLEIYNAATDASEGKPIIVSKNYTMNYDNSPTAPIPEAQLYAHIMALPEITNAVAA